MGITKTEYNFCKCQATTVTFGGNINNKCTNLTKRRNKTQIEIIKARVELVIPVVSSASQGIILELGIRKEEWTKISLEYTKKLVVSMQPDVIKAILQKIKQLFLNNFFEQFSECSIALRETSCDMRIVCFSQ